MACGRVLGQESWLSSVAVATDIIADFSLQVCVAASEEERVKASLVEMESDKELECSSLVCCSGSRILAGDMFGAALLVDFSGGSFEFGSGGFGS